MARAELRIGLDVGTTSADGVVSVTQDSGKTWTNVTPKMSGVPKFTYVADVLPSRAYRRRTRTRCRRT